MKPLLFREWVKISLWNFAAVALLGLLMRYKIGFEFPFFNQKNLQHAHSHFAFAGWISQSIFLLMIYSIKDYLSNSQLFAYQRILYLNIAASYGMLISFSITGYGIFSIICSTLSLSIGFYFTYLFISDLINANQIKKQLWFVAALIFNFLSSLGTLKLVMMMINKDIPQTDYLASIYWYLHFQYNGWFFFSCIGVFINYLSRKFKLNLTNRIFWMLFMSCLPAYGLSTLWANPSLWIYGIIVIAALIQFYAWVSFLGVLSRNKPNLFKNWKRLDIQLLLFALIAVSFKFLLQLGSVIPAISKLAFGFRPIVIAYLHLVLLAFTSVFIIYHFVSNKLILLKRSFKIGAYLLISGVFINELILAIQGIASLSYLLIPWVDYYLLGASIWIFSGIIVLAASQFKNNKIMTAIINNNLNAA